MLWKLVQALFRPRGGQAAGMRGKIDGRAGGNPYPAGTAGAPPADASCADVLQHADALAAAGQLTAALACYRACAEAHPQSLDAWLGAASVLVDLWSIDEAITAYSQALLLAPAASAVFSALLFHSHYRSPPDASRMFSLHRQYGEMMRHAGARAHAGYALAADPQRRLRIAYVSPNFSRHSVGYFIEPVIRCHDRARYAVFCYYSHRLADETTARIRGLADGWRHVAGMGEAALDGMIREDGIDILIDLAGHSKGNALGVLARRPAPVQFTWLGYPDTTGLDAVDYRITDQTADPAPGAEPRHTETLRRIDDCFVCYQPPVDSPPVAARESNGAVVFASFNNLAKLNAQTIRMWGAILTAVPGSRLALKAAGLNFPDTVDRLLDCCERSGIDPSRIELRGWIKNQREHLALYDEIDIALDTFPYNGTTTTCEALWMGVPVITLAGEAHMSRVGASILRCVGLDSLVADGDAEYTEIAIALAHDRGRCRALRAGMRDRMLASPLLDHANFTLKLERHFRQAWEAWCAVSVAENAAGR